MRATSPAALAALALAGFLAGSLAAPAPARAERPEAGHLVAVAVNAPWGWFLGSFGVSAYVALGRHHGLRGNVARYESSAPVLPAVKGALQGRYTKSHGGPIFDVGAAWVWYPRRPWDGPTLEAGLLRRDRETWTYEEADERIDTESTSYGARAMVGWSWMIRRRVFIAIAVGASIQRESGRDTITPDGIMPRSTTKSIERTRIDEEGYLRVGFAFGG